MPYRAFKSNKHHSVGVELELQLIDPKSRELISGTSKILRSLKDNVNIKHELFESVIEINSDPCQTVGKLKENLLHYVKLVHDHAGRLGYKVTMAGTHPKTSWVTQQISPLKRYEDLVERIQMPTKRMLTFGLHVHVGVMSGDEAIVINNALMDYLPHLLALSCSSPFWSKKDSGMESYRVKVLETLPTTGIPFQLRSYEDYIDLVNTLKKAGTIKSIREIWWDIRPHPDYGTVEFRVCDAMPLIDDVIGVASLVQSIVAHLASMYRRRDEIGHLPSFLIRENKWRAARYGIDGEIITNTMGKTVPIKEAVEKLLIELEPTAKELDGNKELHKLRDIFTRGTSSKRQRKVLKETHGNWDAVVDSLINEFEESWQVKNVGARHGEP